MSSTAYLTPREVAGEVRLSVRTVMRAIAAGELEASCLARGKWRIRPVAIECWIDERSNRPQRRRRRQRLAAAARGRGRRGTLMVTADMGRA